MPRQGRRTHSSTTDDGDTELVMRMIELMNDGRVLQELKKQLYPTELYDKLDTLTSKLESISIQLTAKDHIIHTLETTVNHLEQQLDAHEQYSRRPNLRVQGIPEDGRGEDVESKVLSVVNEKMGFDPPLISYRPRTEPSPRSSCTWSETSPCRHCAVRLGANARLGLSRQRLAKEIQ